MINSFIIGLSYALLALIPSYYDKIYKEVP